MVQIQTIKISLIILISIFFIGCNSNDKPIFNLPSSTENNLNNNRFKFAISQEALPINLTDSLNVESNELPRNSIYFSISQSNNTVANFLLNVHVKDVVGIHDIVLGIKFDPALLKFQFNSSESSLIEGPAISRLRKFLPDTLMSLLAVTNPKNAGEILISNNLFEDLGLSQTYQGILFSVPFQAIAPGNFKTAIGFVTASSDIIDRDGNIMDMQFFGGTISQYTEI